MGLTPNTFSSSLEPRLNALGQPIGKALEGFAVCQKLPEVVLRGRTCRLEPFEQETHAQALFDAFHQSPMDLWTYLPIEPFISPDALSAHVAAKRADNGYQTFVIVDAQNQPTGLSSYMRHDLDSGVVEIGFVMFSHALQRTAAATEAMYLMMKHVFDHGYRRYEWKCDQLNTPSMRAALRLGFQFEGIFRNSYVVKRRRRDTAWLSVILEDWPVAKARLEAWLDPGNFDAEGKQIMALGSMALL